MLPDSDASDQIYTIRGNSKLDLHGSFRELRDNNKFSDVSLSCRNVNGGALSIRAHRVILSAYSRIFEDMFGHHPKSTDPMVYLKGVIFEDLKNLLDFMYNGEVSVPQSHLTSFLAAAEDLQVKGLDSDSSDTSVFKRPMDNDNNSTANERRPKSNVQKEEESSTSIKVKREPANMANIMSYNKFMGREDEEENETLTNEAKSTVNNKKRMLKSPQKSDSGDMKRVRRSKIRTNYDEQDEMDFISDYDGFTVKEDELQPKKKTKVTFRSESSCDNETRNLKPTAHKPNSQEATDINPSDSEDENETIKENDLVLATVKGRKPWPAKVTEVVSKGSYKVTFFETLNVNYTDKKVFPTKVVKYNNESKKVLEKDQSEKMKHAIKKIEAEWKLQDV